jgi:hypothetical protein
MVPVLSRRSVSTSPAASTAIHAGDADGGQQRADRGRDQRDEQGHKDDDRDAAADIRNETRNSRGCEYEDDGQADQEDVQCDLVRRFLPLGAFDKADHAVEEGRARRRGDTHTDPVGQHLRAAGDRGAIAARLADDRCGFTGDGRFIDRGHALDHLAVGRNDVAGLDQYDVADLQIVRGHKAKILRISHPGQELGLGFGALTPQLVRLCLAAALGDGLGKVGKQHGEPQPQDDLEFEQDVSAAGKEIADEDHRRQRRDDFQHEHDRVLDQRPRIELDEGGTDRRHDDLRIEQRRDRHAPAQG